MRPSTTRLLFLFVMGISWKVLTPNGVAWGRYTFQETPAVLIQWPLPGQALLGTLEISGSTTVAGYQSAEVSFGYTNDPTETWFLIAQPEAPVKNGVLAIWDTTLITDGNYNLKLSVTLQDGAQISSIVEGVRVRNYSPIEPDTPTPVTPTLTPVPGDTPIPTITPTPTITPIPATSTPLPTNPVILTSTHFVTVFGRGVLVTLAAFVLIGVYLGIKSMLRNRT